MSLEWFISPIPFFKIYIHYFLVRAWRAQILFLTPLFTCSCASNAFVDLKGIEFLSQMPPLWIKQVSGPNKCTHLVTIVCSMGC